MFVSYDDNVTYFNYRPYIISTLQACHMQTQIDELEESLIKEKSCVAELQERLAEALAVNSATASGVADLGDKKVSADEGKKDSADEGKFDSARVIAAEELQRQSKAHLSNAKAGGEKEGNVEVPQTMLKLVPGNQEIVHTGRDLVEERTLNGAELALKNNEIKSHQVVEAVNQTMEMSGVSGGISLENLVRLSNLAQGKY